MTSVLDSLRKLLVNVLDALGRCRKFFEELLIVSEMLINIHNFEVQLDRNDYENMTTFVEVARMVNRFQSNKAADIGKIKLELVKYS